MNLLTDIHKRNFCRADRDVACQLAEVSRILAAVDLEDDRDYSEAEPEQTDLFVHVQRPFFKIEDLNERLEWTKRLDHDSQKQVEVHLQSARKNGAERYVAQAPTPDALNTLLVDFPNFGEVTTFIQKHLTLCRVTRERLLQMPGILLNGEHGVGKTAYANALAAIFDIPKLQVDVSTLDGGFTLAGLDISWRSAKPGRIWEVLDGPCMSPLVLLDEIDKIGSKEHGGINVLHALLEPKTAMRFIDAALGLPVDASRILWLATSNDTRDVAAPILSRFRVFEVSAPGPDQFRAVVLSVHRSILKSNEWGDYFDPSLSNEIIAKLSGLTSRQIGHALIDGYARAAHASRRQLDATDIEVGCPSNAPIPMGFL